MPNPSPGPVASLAEPGAAAGAAVALPGHDLLARIGHELRSPLTGIVGLSRIMLLKLAAGELDTERQVRQLELIRSNAGSALRTVDRIVEVVRLQAAVPARERFDCRPVVAAAAEAFGPAAVGRPLLLLDLPGRPVVVAAAPDRLDRLLRELLDNVVRHADAGRVRLAVRPAPGAAVIEVADDGVGIPAAEQARVFAPFERGEAAAGRDAVGDGLGLYLARMLAEQCDSRLDLRSSPGAGSTFRLEIPAPEIPEPAPRQDG